ncbi:MAG: GNAT family N-acetyltransferase, partial [bacterium]
MKFILRKASEADVKQVADFAEMLHLDNDGIEASKCFVVKENRNLAGFGRYKNHGNISEISTVGVLEAYRRLG